MPTVTTEMIVEAFRECSIDERTDFLNQIARSVAIEDIVMPNLCCQELVDMCAFIAVEPEQEPEDVVITLGRARS